MNIIFVSTAKFPDCDAEATRLSTFAKLLSGLGNNITFFGYSDTPYLEEEIIDENKYISIRKKLDNKATKIFYRYYKTPIEIIKYLDIYIKKHPIDVIIMSDLSNGLIRSLKKFSKKNHINLIMDSVEWYSPSQYKLGIFSPLMIEKNIEARYLINKDVRVIAISKYLQNYFESKNCSCIRVPVILDVKNMKCDKDIDEDKLTLLYAGSPGKKDHIKEILEGIALLDDKDIRKIKFILAGVKESDVKLILSSRDYMRIENSIECLGRISHEDVLKLLKKVDFTVLLRASQERYAKAGFPTKVVESLSTATPVILNYSSDLSDYIRDKCEGIIVDACSSYSFSESLKVALRLTNKEKIKMKKNARLCAENNFDYRKYESMFDSLIKNNI